MVFLCNGSSIPSPFHAYNCNSARFFLIFQIKRPNFLIQKRIFRVNFLHISYMFSSYKQMIFSAMEAWFRRIFMRIIAILPGFFSDFPDKTSKFFDTKTYFQSQFPAYFIYVFFLQADDFLSNGSLIPSHFHAYIYNSAGFFLIFQIKRPNFLIQKRIFRVNFSVFKQFKKKAPI